MSGRIGIALAAALVVVVTGSVALPGAHASSTSPAGTCGKTGRQGTASCVYATVGSDSFTVPSGVATATFVVAGAQGGGGLGNAGASGGLATATLAVKPGQVFQIDVGGAGAFGSATETTAAAGGFGGSDNGVPGGPGDASGGAGGLNTPNEGNGGGGGGSSDVRGSGTTSCASLTCPLSARLIVAGGGGGTGGNGGLTIPPAAAGASGGPGGGAAGSSGSIGAGAFPGAGGGGGTASADGVGGTNSVTGNNGAAGSSAAGGAGGAGNASAGGGGGGGGGGWFGGGGGSGGGAQPGGGGGGAGGSGGGGSGYVVSTALAESLIQAPAAAFMNGGNGEVTVYWMAPALTFTASASQSGEKLKVSLSADLPGELTASLSAKTKPGTTLATWSRSLAAGKTPLALALPKSARSSGTYVLSLELTVGTKHVSRALRIAVKA